MFNPTGTSDSLDYIELRADVPGSPFPLDDFSISSGVEFQFYAGTSISNGDYIIVAKDSVAFENTFGIEAYQWSAGQLENGGDSISVVHEYVEGYISMSYDDNPPWPQEANGGGASLVLCGNSWQASQNNTGIVVNGITIYADPGQASSCITVGLVEQKDPELISIYPNPATTNLTIESRTPLAQVWVRDVAGRAVLPTLRLRSGCGTIDVRSLPSGIYLVEALTQNGQRSVQKVVVE